MFIKVNDQVIKCVIPADEISSLGFQVEEIFSSKEKATEFIKEVVAAASSQGLSRKIHISSSTRLVMKIMNW